ncbi:MAG TPA: chloride channel protein [Bacteroidales bacterium]|nr:chloride channel protein [Bacteroidales bacterium]
MPGSKFYQRIHSWRLRHIAPRNFVLILSLLAGSLGGFAAILLKNAVYLGHLLLTQVISIRSFNLLYLFLPFIGILITYLYVKYIVRDNIGHGISRVLQSISKSNSIMKAHNMYTSMIASTITVMFGGSVGLEAPIVLTGSAIGSNLGRYLRVDYKTITLLLGCGAAGAIAGIFKAPIAGVIFAMEVLMLDLTMASLIPLMVSSTAGAILAYFFMGPAVLFSFEVTAHPFTMHNLPFYALLGLLCGMVSIYFTKANMSIEKQFRRIPGGTLRMVTGGLITSLLVFLFPPLFGEGYETLNNLLDGNGLKLLDGSIFASMGNNYFLLLLFLVFILIFKVVAMSATTGGGGVGGVFAPSLFMGGVTGFFLSKSVNFFLNGRLPESNFALAGMAGVMAAVMHAPLTAIFLIAEITGGYQFFVPLMLTSVVAYLTIIPFEPHSIYTKRLAESGELITHHKDKAVLSRLSIESLIERNFIPTSPEVTLGEFVKLVAKSQRNVFPVIDQENNFLGVIFINDIRHIIFEHDQYDTVYIRNLMYMPDTLIEYNATMEDVAQKFAETAHYNLPVLKDGKYIGFVSRANVFSAYRKLVKDFSND